MPSKECPRTVPRGGLKVSSTAILSRPGQGQ